MPKDCRPDGTGYEADRIDRECLERSRQRVRVWKKQFRKDEAGHDAIEKEIVPFDGGADRAGNHGAAQLDLMLMGREAARPFHGCHGCSPETPPPTVSLISCAHG